jgi:DNA uptake protein ComE-like DNA-binding protein
VSAIVAVVTPYTRHQLLLVLLLVAAAGAGLGVDRWRRAYPERAARLEALDRAQPAVLGAESFRPASPWQAGGLPARTRPPAGSRATGPLDVNRASAGELAGLPGIGPALASRIVAARPFGGIDDLRRVRGLRRGTLERLRPLVTAGNSTDAE